MSFIYTVIVTCSLMLTLQHSALAQSRSKQGSPRAMVQRLQQEIEALQDKIAEDPSSPEVGEIKTRIQWNMRKMKQIAPQIKVRDDKKSQRTQVSGVEQYRNIVKNNLFMPLGSGGEAKREEFVLIGTMGKSAFIQMEGSDKSFYVAEGQSFGNGAKLAQVGEKSATIIHEGNRKELRLFSGTLVSQGEDPRGGRSRQRQGDFGKNGGKTKTANRAEKERRGGAEKGRWDEGEKKGGDNDWARKMSIDELRGVRGKIAEHIEGLRRKGVTDPDEYQGALEKLEEVKNAIGEKGNSR